MALNFKVGLIGLLDMLKFANLAKDREKVIAAAPANEITADYPVNNFAKAMHPDFQQFVIDEIIKYHNAFPHMEGLLIRTTVNIGNVKVDQKERASGSSGYNLKKLLTTWVNGLTTFSIKPLRIAVILGMLMALIGFIIIIALVIIKLTGPKMAHGWTSLVAINVLIGGMIMIMLGVIGEYVGRIYQCLNQNPQYVVRETINYERAKE